MLNFWALIIAFIVSLGITPLTIWFYKKKNWIDDPNGKKEAKVIHKKAVPRGGGIPIITAILISSILFLPLDKHLWGILIGALILVILGILDDIYDINPKIRLVGGFFAALIVVGAGIGIAFISNPLGGVIRLDQPQIPIYLLGKTRVIWLLADIFAIFWIVSLMNFINWSKGLDGQLPGTVAIAALIIAILSQKFSADITQWGVGILALIVCGAYLGFLPWNFFPQKIMPGYGGGSLAGYFLAILAIISTTKVGTLIIVLAIPFVDAIFVIIRRIASGKSPIWGDTRHLHHTLLRLGWSKKNVAFFYWGITLFLGILSLLLNSQEKFFTIIVIVILFLGFLLWIKRSKI